MPLSLFRSVLLFQLVLSPVHTLLRQNISESEVTVTVITKPEIENVSNGVESVWEDLDYDLIFENVEGDDYPDVLQIGCIASWGERFANVSLEYGDNQTPALCAAKCRQKHPDLKVIFLRGGECECSKLLYLPSVVGWGVRSDLCNIPCPVTPGRVEHDWNGMCGGNRAYSMYASTRDPYIDWRNTVKTLLSLSPAESNASSILPTNLKPKPVLLEPCAVCDYSKEATCKRPFSPADFDHFPANSPEDCVTFCGNIRTATFKVDLEVNRTHYAGNVTSVLELAKKYALVTWWREGANDIPICRCLSEREREYFSPVESTCCGRSCPGKPSATCGGLESDGRIYATIYCVSLEDGDCPSAQDSGKGRVIANCEMKSKSKHFMETNYLQDGTCSKVDSYGVPWKVFGNFTEFMPCSRLVANASGLASWHCSGEGKFAKSQPDVSGCSSPGVKELRERVEGINQIADADRILEDLENTYWLSDSNPKYFGHEIHSISSFIGEALSKVTRMARAGNSSSELLEPVIGMALDITVNLIQHRGPWESLPNSNKSNTSTHLLETMEQAMFGLTANHRVGQNFTLYQSNAEDDGADEDPFDFFIFAETVTETNDDDEGYEFPKRESRGEDDSYLKLPPGWKQSVNKTDEEHIQIVAMSMGASYISYMMPGQFEELAHSQGLKGNEDVDSKLINGKVMTFTIDDSKVDGKSGGNPPVTFTGKGVEIVFQHDIQAWGNERQEIPRNLHRNEKPKAVLGSVQCVNWDKIKLTWSNSSCRVVRSDGRQTVCECFHLASFAVLMDVHGYVGKDIGLGLLTMFLCSLSELALLTTIIALHLANNGIHRIERNFDRMRNLRIRLTTTKNLAGCLFIGHAMILLVLDRDYFYMTGAVCAGSGMLTHFVFLSAFMWMMVEGLLIRRMVVEVFDSKKSYFRQFALLSYGVPALIVLATGITGYSLGHQPYGGDVYCWLEGSYIWSFMGPVAIAVTVNVLLLGIVSYKLFQRKYKQRVTAKTKKYDGSTTAELENRIKAYGPWLRGCLFLTCILGITWIIGFFTLIDSPAGIVAAYLFTVLNASQGIFIFLLNCVFNEKIRKFLLHKLGNYLPPALLPSVCSPTHTLDTSYTSHSSSNKPKLPPRVPSRRQDPQEEDSSPFPSPTDRYAEEPLIQELKSRLFATDGDMAYVNQKPLMFKAESFN